MLPRMAVTPIRRCSVTMLVVQAAWLVATLAGNAADTWLGLLGAVVQVLLAAAASGIAFGAWLVARPRGASLLWLLAMPAAGAAASTAAWLVLSRFRWGC